MFDIYYSCEKLLGGSNIKLRATFVALHPRFFSGVKGYTATADTPFQVWHRLSGAKQA